MSGPSTTTSNVGKAPALVPASVLAAAKALNASDIKGNVTDEEKQLGAAIFSYFISTPDQSYGASIGQRLKFKEMNVFRRDGSGCGSDQAAYGETIFEIKVEKDMCNIFGTLHGACAAYIIDPCSVSSLVTLGRALGLDGSGVSQSMNLIWHQPVLRGSMLRVVSTSMFLQGRVRTARCELWVGDKLCVSAVHSTITPSRPTAKNLMKGAKL